MDPLDRMANKHENSFLIVYLKWSYRTSFLEQQLSYPKYVQKSAMFTQKLKFILLIARHKKYIHVTLSYIGELL